MKKIFLKIIMVALIGATTYSCQEYDKDPVLSSSALSKVSTKNDLSGSYIITESNLKTPFHTFVINRADYGVPIAIKYKFEVAKAGTNFSPSAIVGDEFTSEYASFTYEQLNKALTSKIDAGGLGLKGEEAHSLELRIVGTPTEGGGANVLSKTYSDVFKITVTPMRTDLPKFFMVGQATVPGWTASNALPMYQDPINNAVISLYTYLNGNENFRFLGQQDWNPINYSVDFAGKKDNYKFFKTWSTNLTPAGDDENIAFTGVSGYYKVAIDFAQKDLKIESVASVFRDDYPELYLAGSFQGWDASNGIAVPSVGNGVYEINLTLPSNAEFKILGQKSWGAIDYGNIGKNNHGYHGFLGYKEDNGNIKFDGGGASCKIRKYR